MQKPSIAVKAVVVDDTVHIPDDAKLHQLILILLQLFLVLQFKDNENKILLPSVLLYNLLSLSELGIFNLGIR